MELAYEGSISFKKFEKSSSVLKEDCLNYLGKDVVKTYWDFDEQGPVAEINLSELIHLPLEVKEGLVNLCLDREFMVRKFIQ